MEYQIGDKVRIREDLKMYKKYNGIGASEGMLKYGGEIAVIAKQRSINQYDLGINGGGYLWTPEMFDQNWKEDKFMKTSEFEKELEKMGYRLNINTYIHRIKDNATVAVISSNEVNIIDTNWNRPVSDELLSLLTRYASTPIAERKDEPKLFNVQIIKGNWGRTSWLYRYGDKISVSSSEDNHDLNQQWTLAQIKEYEIDDESVYKRVPVED